MHDLEGKMPKPKAYNTNAFIIFTCHCEPEGRGNLIYLGLSRFTPRNGKLFNAFVLVKSTF